MVVGIIVNKVSIQSTKTKKFSASRLDGNLIINTNYYLISCSVNGLDLTFRFDPSCSYTQINLEPASRCFKSQGNKLFENSGIADGGKRQLIVLVAF